MNNDKHGDDYDRNCLAWRYTAVSDSVTSCTVLLRAAWCTTCSGRRYNDDDDLDDDKHRLPGALPAVDDDDDLDDKHRLPGALPAVDDDDDLDDKHRLPAALPAVDDDDDLDDKHRLSAALPAVVEDMMMMIWMINTGCLLHYLQW